MTNNSDDESVPPPPPVAEGQGPAWFNTAKPRFEPVKVHFAINNGDLKSVQKCINNGYDLNYVIHGNTPLTLAIIKDQFEIAHLLVESGSDVNVPENTKWKRLPIHLAACAGEVELVRKIIDSGCPVDARDTTDLTALHWASLQGHNETVEYLVDAGANVLLRDDSGRTSLHRAAENGHAEIVRFLFASGAGINDQDLRGWSALFQAVACNDINLVKTLLELGIDVNLEDSNQETSLHIIANRLRGRNILVLCRTDVNIYTRHLAVFNAAVQRAQQTLGNDLAIAELLIDNGADVNKKNLWGESAAKISADEGYGAILKLLYEAGANFAFESWMHGATIPSELASNVQICEWLKLTVSANPRPLQEICKFVIRSQIRRNINHVVEALPLPSKLITFLKLCV